MRVFAVAAIYTIGVLVLPFSPANADYAEPDHGHTIFLHSNGVHSDIVLPVRTAAHDWSQVFPVANTVKQDSTLTHIGIGWGDKGFYLETKEWADLKASTALKALLGVSGTALHVTYMPQPVPDVRTRAVRISTTTLEKLIARMSTGYAPGTDGKPVWIRDRHYGDTDSFYEGTGRYGPHHTCNTWTNNVLKDCGLPAALWTATAGGVLRQYH